jgi:hypothetical protein
MSYAYRSAYQHMLGRRIAEMRAAHEVVAPWRPRLRSIHAARIARAMAGGVGLVGTATVGVLALTEARAELTYTLVGSSVAALVTYTLVRFVFMLGALGRKDVRPPRLTGHLNTDLSQLESSDPLRSLVEQLSRLELSNLEVWSTALPLAALSMLMPLTLHFGFIKLTSSESAESFATWIRVSLVVVGHAHLALMIMAIRFAKKLRRATLDELTRMSVHREWARAWGITIGVACVPSILLLAIPPILVAVTGIAFIPLMFILVHKRLVAERLVLAQANAVSTVPVEVSDMAPRVGADASWPELDGWEDADAMLSRGSRVA